MPSGVHKRTKRQNLIDPNTRYGVWNCGYATNCWLWTGPLRDGYGLATVWEAGKWKTMNAHVYLYLKAGKIIPDGLVLDHLCKIRKCVNPDHVEPKTRLENTRLGYHTKITLLIAREIREKRKLENWSVVQIAEHFKIAQPTVYDVLRNATWKEVKQEEVKPVA